MASHDNIKIFSEAKLKQLREARDRLEKDRLTHDKATITKSQNQQEEDQPPATTSPDEPPRELPQNTKPAHHPLLVQILSIPTILETRRAEEDVIAFKEARDELNAEIDELVPIYYHEMSEEIRLHNLRDAFLTRRFHAHVRRRNEAQRKKTLERGVRWEQFRVYRRRLRRELFEKGEFDLVGREGESHEAWWERMEKLSEPILQLWNKYKVDCRAAVPRYLEGFPAREHIYAPRAYTGEFRSSGKAPCWQCQVKKMRCSLELVRYTNLGHLEWRGHACSRCVRQGDGEECCVRSELLPFGWRKAEMTKAGHTAIKNDPVLREQANAEVQERMRAWAYKNCPGLKVDFFATHVQSFDFETNKVTKRRVPKYNKTWWDNKKKLEQARMYRMRRKQAGMPLYLKEQKDQEERERVKEASEEKGSE